MSYVMYCTKQPVAPQRKYSLDADSREPPHTDQLVTLSDKRLNLRLQARELIFHSLVVLLVACKIFLKTLYFP